MEDQYKVYNISSKVVVEKDGKEQTIWNKIGSLVIYENGTGKLRLNMFPSESYHIFDKEFRRDEMNAGQKRALSLAQEIAEG